MSETVREGTQAIKQEQNNRKKTRRYECRPNSF